MSDIRILHGDARNLINQIPDHSIDLIFTDPPYPKEFMPLYGWLADESNRVLKPTGFVAMYVGCYWLADVIRLIDDRLDYFMELVIHGAGFGSMMWQKRVIGKHKSVMLYRPKNGVGMPRCNVTSVFTGTGADKHWHVWGQDEASARYYIDCLSKIGDLVLDPFVGGGTTPAMCKILRRKFIGFELGMDEYNTALMRVEAQQIPLIADVFSSPDGPEIQEELYA